MGRRGLAFADSLAPLQGVLDHGRQVLDDTPAPHPPIVAEDIATLEAALLGQRFAEQPQHISAHHRADGGVSSRRVIDSCELLRERFDAPGAGPSSVNPNWTRD